MFKTNDIHGQSTLSSLTINDKNNNVDNNNLTNSNNYKLQNSLQNQSISSLNSDSITSVNRINEEYHTYQLNEKVTSLATSIYQELEKIIKDFGRDTVKDLMPIVVNILEALDLSYQEKEELKVENELLKDDNEQLLNQYEREKQFRKDCEQKQFQVEDALVEQKKEYEEKLQSLESIVRMIELKAKNATDHVARLEEKEVEMKREYTKLHERYTELFKTHCDYMERNKILYGLNGDDNESDNEQRRKNDFVSNNKKINQLSQQLQKSMDDLLKSKSMLKNSQSSDMINQLNNSNRSEISNVITNLLQEIEQQQGQNEENNNSNNDDHTLNNSNENLNNSNNNNNNNNIVDDDVTAVNSDFITNKVLISAENFDEHITEFDGNNSLRDIEEISEDEAYSKNDLSLFNELSRENYDPSEVDDGADLSGMTREVANLIRENTELLQTKHALNVLKDDLIAKLDRFSSEMIILREEIKSLQTVKACLQLRISELEEESKKTREELSQRNYKSEEEDENVPMSQRKRFTRAEMARVLMERNQYKERLMDLQEAVRWTEYMRASKVDPTLSMQNNKNIAENQEKKKSPIWKFFSGLFGSKTQQDPNQRQSSSPVSSRRGTIEKSSGSSIEQVVPYSELNNNIIIPEKVAKAYEFLNKENAIALKKNQSVEESNVQKQLVIKDKCRIQAYGWSLPSKTESETITSTNNQNQIDDNKSNMIKNDCNLSIPVPIYCQPIFDRDNDLKPSCSTILNTIDQNNKSSSLVWICSLSKNDTHVSILDPNNPKEQKEQFVLKSMKVLCVQSVNGVTNHQLINNTDSTTTDCHKVSSLNSTLWFGTQEGYLLIHSVNENLTSNSLEKVKLKDAVLSILQTSDIVIVGLADGSIIMFNRDDENSQWDLKNFKSIALDIGHCSVRYLITVNDYVWCGAGNKIYEINPQKHQIMGEIEAHPRKESQVRHMVCVGDGVWVSIRLDSTLRLFHAKTKQHLQYLDIEPFVTRMLGTSSLGISLTRITSIIAASNYLWIGTGNGAIISIPFSKTTNDVKSETESDNTQYLPYCNLNKAQFSFHGHRDAVRFFLQVAGKGLHKVQSDKNNDSTNDNKIQTIKTSNTMLVLSGGQGYVDFRVSDQVSQVDTNNENSHKNILSNSKIDRSYLIVWQI